MELEHEQEASIHCAIVYCGVLDLFVMTASPGPTQSLCTCCALCLKSFYPDICVVFHFLQVSVQTSS